jgi:tryptophanyl-tRNA synthetase
LQDRFSGRGYGDFKGALADAVVEFLRPVRERYEQLMSDPGELDGVLGEGGRAAAQVAEATMDDVFEVTGLGQRGRASGKTDATVGPG